MQQLVQQVVMISSSLLQITFFQSISIMIQPKKTLPPIPQTQNSQHTHTQHHKPTTLIYRPHSAHHHHRILYSQNSELPPAVRPKSNLQLRIKVNSCKALLKKYCGKEGKGVVSEQEVTKSKRDSVYVRRQSLGIKDVREKKPKDMKSFTIKKTKATMKRCVSLDTIQLHQRHQQIIQQLQAHSKELENKVVNHHYPPPPQATTEQKHEEKEIRGALKVFKDSGNYLQLRNNYMMNNQEQKLKKTCFKLHIDKGSSNNKTVACKTIQIPWRKSQRALKDSLQQSCTWKQVIEVTTDKYQANISLCFQGISKVYPVMSIETGYIQQNITLKRIQEQLSNRIAHI